MTDNDIDQEHDRTVILPMFDIIIRTEYWAFPLSMYFSNEKFFTATVLCFEFVFRWGIPWTYDSHCKLVLFKKLGTGQGNDDHD